MAALYKLLVSHLFSLTAAELDVMKCFVAFTVGQGCSLEWYFDSL